MAESHFSIQLDDGLPPQIEGLGERIREHLAENGRVGGRVLWSAAGSDALTALGRSVSIDLIGAFGKAWATLAELHEYADPKRHRPDEDYALGETSVELDAEPSLVVRLGPFESPPMKFGYTITADFVAVNLTIGDGMIKAAALGGCRLTGVLSYRGEALHPPVPLAAGRLPGRIEFKPPVRIP